MYIKYLIYRNDYRNYLINVDYNIIIIKIIINIKIIRFVFINLLYY